MRTNNTRAVKEHRRRERTVNEQGPPAEFFDLRMSNRGYLPDWLRAFMPEAFALEFSADHIEMLELMQETIEGGGMYALAMPRGSGKTTGSIGAALWGVLEGHIRYCVLVGAESKSASEMLDIIKSNLLHNELIQKAYSPVIGWSEPREMLAGGMDFDHTGYISAGEGTAAKYKALLRPDGEKCNAVWGNSPPKIVLPTLSAESIAKYDVRCSGAVFEAKALIGGLRGMKHALPTGEILRPDFVIADDPQTRESAESLPQTKKRLQIMRGDLMGLAGPNKTISVVVPCTVIKEGDLADQLLDRSANPEFRGIKKQLVNSWPKAQDTLWQEFAGIYRECLRNGERTTAATDFYAANRDAMDEGAVMSWPQRHEPHQLSALQYAEEKLIVMGEEAFYAEMQNEPKTSQATIYELSIEQVANSLSGLAQYELGLGSHFGTCMIDINDYGLHWVALGTATEFAGNIAGWGKFPGGNKRLFYSDMRDGTTKEQAIWSGLNQLIDALVGIPWTRNGKPSQLDAVTIDCGYEMHTVFNFCRHKMREGLPFRLIPSRGIPASKYRPSRPIGRVGNNYHVTAYSHGNVLAHSADYWRMATQKSFLLPTGAPGSIGIFGKNANDNRELAEQITAERLVEYYQGQNGDMYQWAKSPGRRNDLLDALVGAVVAAHFVGARTAGTQELKPKPTTKKRSRVSVTKI